MLVLMVLGVLEFQARRDRQLLGACLTIRPADEHHATARVTRCSCSLGRESQHSLASHNS